jgi:hypothetical protein
MKVRVVLPPDPIVLPSDIVGAHDADDTVVAGLIQAITEAIDGPGGWLGRSLGPQTLVASPVCWWDKVKLPYGPVIAIDAISYFDESDEEHIIDASNWSRDGDWIWFGDEWSAPTLSDRPFPISVQYQAGYNGEDISDDDGTGPVPERARQAIILSAQHLKSLGIPSLYLKVDDVVGVGRKEYTLSEQATKIVEITSERLLSTLRVFS